MSDQLILDDEALSLAASHFRDAASPLEQKMRAPLGEVAGVTDLELRFNEFLCGVSDARRVLSEAAHAGAAAVTALMSESTETDAGINVALNGAALNGAALTRGRS